MSVVYNLNCKNNKTFYFTSAHFIYGVADVLQPLCLLLIKSSYRRLLWSLEDVEKLIENSPETAEKIRIIYNESLILLFLFFITFQLLCIVSTILVRNPELTLKELDLDNLIVEANKMFCKVNTFVGKLSLEFGHFCDKIRIKSKRIINVFKNSFENILIFKKIQNKS